MFVGRGVAGGGGYTSKKPVPNCDNFPSKSKMWGLQGVQGDTSDTPQCAIMNARDHIVISLVGLSKVIAAFEPEIQPGRVPPFNPTSEPWENTYI